MRYATPQDFQKYHGVTPETPMLRPHPHAAFFLLPDGAAVNASIANDFREPSEDEDKRAEAVLLYRKARIENACD